MTNIANWKISIFNGTITIHGPFSVVTLNYRRVSKIWDFRWILHEKKREFDMDSIWIYMDLSTQNGELDEFEMDLIWRPTNILRISHDSWLINMIQLPPGMVFRHRKLRWNLNKKRHGTLLDSWLGTAPLSMTKNMSFNILHKTN